jgi:hypothetical protein
VPIPSGAHPLQLMDTNSTPARCVTSCADATISEVIADMSSVVQGRRFRVISNRNFVGPRSGAGAASASAAWAQATVVLMPGRMRCEAGGSRGATVRMQGSCLRSTSEQHGVRHEAAQSADPERLTGPLGPGMIGRC